jgi:hypothetical protein
MISQTAIRQRAEAYSALEAALRALDGSNEDWDGEPERIHPPVGRMPSMELADRLQMTVHELAARLRRAGVKARPMRFRNQVRRGYPRADLVAARKRFLADPLNRAASFYGGGPYPESPQEHRELMEYVHRTHPDTYGPLNWDRQSLIDAEVRALEAQTVHIAAAAVTSL